MARFRNVRFMLYSNCVGLLLARETEEKWKAEQKKMLQVIGFLLFSSNFLSTKGGLYLSFRFSYRFGGMAVLKLYLIFLN